MSEKDRLRIKKDFRIKIRLLTGKINLGDFFIYNIFYILGALYIAKMVINFVPIGLSLICIEFLVLILTSKYKYKTGNKELYLYLYIFLSMISIGSLLNGEFEVNNYFVGIYNMVLPVFFAFWGQKIQHYSSEEKKRLNNIWCRGLFFCIFVGLFLHIFNPEFYHSYVRDSYMLVYNTDIDIYFGGRIPRFRGIFLSSQIAGIIGVVAICFTIDNSFLKRWVKFLYLVVFGLSVLLSYQRAAWVLLVCVLLYYMWMRKRRILLQSVITFFPIIITFLYLFREKIYAGMSIQFHGEYESTPLELIKSIPNVIAERFSMSGSTKAISDFLEAPVFGKGLAHLGGSLDANYHRVLSDLGLVGLGLLILIIIYIMKFTYRNENLGVGMSALCVAVNALGEPMFDNIVTGGLFFWLMIGCLSKTEVSGFEISKNKCHSPCIQYRKIYQKVHRKSFGANDK